MELQQYIKLKRMLFTQEQQLLQLSLNIEHANKLLNEVELDAGELKEYMLDFYSQYEDRLYTIKHLKEITSWSLKDCHHYVLDLLREDQENQNSQKKAHEEDIF